MPVAGDASSWALLGEQQASLAPDVVRVQTVQRRALAAQDGAKRRYPQRGNWAEGNFIATMTGESLTGRRSVSVKQEWAKMLSLQARRSDRPPRKRARPVRVGRADSPPSCIELLEDSDLRITLGQQLLEPRVLDLHGLEAFDISSLHRTEVHAPGLDGGVDDVPQFGGLGLAGVVCFSQHGHRLFYIESALSHGLFAGGEPSP